MRFSYAELITFYNFIIFKINIEFIKKKRAYLRKRAEFLFCLFQLYVIAESLNYVILIRFFLQQILRPLLQTSLVLATYSGRSSLSIMRRYTLAEECYKYDFLPSKPSFVPQSHTLRSFRSRKPFSYLLSHHQKWSSSRRPASSPDALKAVSEQLQQKPSTPKATTSSPQLGLHQRSRRRSATVIA